MSNKRAYDIQCNPDCRTKSRTELEKQFGKLNSTLHGYEFDKPCKFPFRIAGKLFYGCVWSELSGPWCYTERIERVKYSNAGTTIFKSLETMDHKWGLCSDNCPIEDCPNCNFPFRYGIPPAVKTYNSCIKGGFSVNETTDFDNKPWCKYDKDWTDWKFCSDKCEPNSTRVNSQCKKNKKDSRCIHRPGHGAKKWCPVLQTKNQTTQKIKTTWAVCVDQCPNNRIIYPNESKTEETNFLLYSIFIPIITVLIAILVGLVSWKKCKKKSSREFVLLQDNLSTKAAENRSNIKFRVDEKTSNFNHTSDTLCYSTAISSVDKTLAKTLEGDLSKINPHKSLNEQVHVIPYNSKYEIQFENFTTGQIIGSGNFGTVYEGEAKIPFFSFERSKVAIKTVTQHSNQDQFSSLISEIKILSNLEIHLNLVNMLGCCSSKLGPEGKLWLFLEFCNESDIKTYLIEHAKVFSAGIYLDEYFPI